MPGQKSCFDRKIRMAHAPAPSYAFNIMTTNAILNLAEATEMAHSNQSRDENDQSLYWQAVLARDASQDGRFVFAVSSTGVYCRPSCPARRPRRVNVTFFRKPDEAENAGYRACLRCRPKAAGGNGTTEMVKAMCRYIEQHLDEPLTLARLGAEFHQSPFHLQRTFKSVLGITPRAYADSCRMNQLKDNLRAGHSVTRSMYDAGYSSSSRLYERTASQLGMTPDKYRRGAIAAPIRYTCADSPLGRMLIAATDKGICSIQFGNSDGELEQGLRHEFPFANRRRDDEAMQSWKKDLLRQMRGQRLNCRSSPGYSSYRVSATRVGTLAIHSVRGNAFLRRSGESHRTAHCHTSGCPSLRHQPSRNRHSVSSRSQEERKHGRLPVGRGKKKSSTRDGTHVKQSMEDGRPARPAKTLKLGAGRARLDRLRKNTRFVSGYAFRHTVSR